MYKQKIRDLKREMILETRKCLLKKNVGSLRMTSPFKINNEQKVNGDYMVIPLVVEEVDIYGNVTTVDYNGTIIELSLEELDVYDLAHLHSQVTKENYKVIDYIEEVEESPDPSV